MEFKFLLESIRGFQNDSNKPPFKLTTDSRKIDSNSIFFAVVGSKQDGHDFISDVLDRGAFAAVVNREHPKAKKILSDQQRSTRVCIVADTRAAYGILSAEFFKNPSKQLQIFGVTGTNGKTSVTHFIENLFNQCGLNTALIGTLENRFIQQSKSKNVRVTSSHTTPDAFELQKMLRTFVDNQAGAVAMEVSSHGLEQKRVAGTKFKANLFLNLTQDHLDYHGNMENYFAAKSRLFLDYESDFRLIHLNSEYSVQLIQLCKKNGLSYQIFGHAKKIIQNPSLRSILSQNQIDFDYSEMESTSTGIQGNFIFNDSTQVSRMPVQAPLYGEFNVENLAAALALGVLLKISSQDLSKATRALRPVPGRMEKVSNEHYEVFVDYAHTPDALEKALMNLRKEIRGKLFCLFGCGGDRDTAKRPKMGSIAEKLADVVIVTTDNPRNEDPQKIVNEIVDGIKKSNKLQVHLDRKTAIKNTIDQMTTEDRLLIAGKGHETYQIIKGQKIDFDDKKIAEEVLNAKS